MEVRHISPRGKFEITYMADDQVTFATRAIKPHFYATSGFFWNLSIHSVFTLPFSTLNFLIRREILLTGYPMYMYTVNLFHHAFSTSSLKRVFLKTVFSQRSNFMDICP